MNVLELSPRDFSGYLREMQSMGTPPEQIANLQRAYRDANTGFGLLAAARDDERALAQEGRAPLMGGLLSIPQEDARQGLIPQIGGLLSGGARNVEYEGVMPMVRSMAAGTARAANAPASAAMGLVPREDMIGEAMGTAGLAMGGGGAFTRPDGSVGMGGRPTKEQLDPQRLSKIKMPAPVGDIEYTATPIGTLVPQQIIDIADLQGTTLIPAFGDRTYGGATLEEIQGIKLDKPVEMQGGHDFMRDRGTGLWASEESAMGPKARFIDKLIQEGEDPRMVYTAMGGQSADFSHHMADATMGLIEQSKIPKKAAAEYDKLVREKLDPNWVGILSDNARDYLHNNMTGTLRRELWQEMDKDKWKKMGFPHLGLARVSITDPDLLTVDPFSTGLSVGKPTGGGLLSKGDVTPHYSYDSQIGGTYEGRLGQQVAGDLIWRDFFKDRRDAGIPASGDQRSFMMSPYTKQTVDQQMVDEVSRYLEQMGGRM